MTIDRINIGKPGIDRTQASQASELVPESGKGRQVCTGSDSAALSKAKELGPLVSTINQSRTEQLEKVREALESGTYQVSAEAIAEKLIEANKK